MPFCLKSVIKSGLVFHCRPSDKRFLKSSCRVRGRKALQHPGYELSGCPWPVFVVIGSDLMKQDGVVTTSSIFCFTCQSVVDQNF